MLDICRKIFSALEEKGVRYCHWKSNEHLIPGLVGDTDLDILVDERDKAKCLEVYRALKVLALDSQFGSRYPHVEDYLAFDGATGKLIHLHQHYRLVTGHTGLKEYVLPFDEAVLDTRVRHAETGIYVAAPEAELYVLTLRVVFKSREETYKQAKGGSYALSDDVLREINYLKGLCSRQSCLDFWAKHGMDAALAPFIWDGELKAAEFVKLYEYVHAHFEGYSRLSPLKHKVLMRAYPFMIRANRALRKRLHWNVLIKKAIPGRGLAVAFIGQDGCGKSTVTTQIEKWLNWKVDARRFYLGSGDYFSPWQKKALKLVSGKKKSPVFSHISGLLSVSLCHAASKNALRELKRAQRYVGKGGVALFDRFPQRDFEGIFDGPKIRALFLKKTGNPLFKGIIGHYAAREEANLRRTQDYLPDVVFKLILSVDESMRRKPENHRPDIERKHEIAEKLAFPGSKVVVVDAEGPYEAEIIQIKNVIWETLFER